MTDTTPEAIERMADYYNRWAHDIREMNGASVDADHADLTAATLRELLAENERLRATHAVKVKPLTWEELGDKWNTVTSGQIQITQKGVRPYWSLSCSSPETDLDYDSLEDAKEAAQKEHERRILSAIDTDNTLTELLKAEREKALREVLAKISGWTDQKHIAEDMRHGGFPNRTTQAYAIERIVRALIEKPTQEQD